MVLLRNPKLISAIHIVIVVPLLVLLATNRFPNQYKKYLLFFAAFVGLYHLYKLYKVIQLDMNYEGMQQINGLNVHNIKMFDSSPGFEHPVLNVNKGDVVVWTNVGEIEHTVTGLNQEFDSGYMKPGDRFSVRFTDSGTFDYYCIPHKGWMIGRIIVD